MGQQQLLLLVLGIVIVGLAVVGGIEVFSENKAKSDFDRHTSRGVAVMGDLFSWYQKPEMAGGAGGNASNLANLTSDMLGIQNNSGGTWASFPVTGLEANGTRVWIGASTTHPFAFLNDIPHVDGTPTLEVHAFGPHQECIVTRRAIWGDATWSDGKEMSTAPDNPDSAACSW